ncbi:MAG: BrnA antitoxin family protein [Casimicrobium sp.]
MSPDVKSSTRPRTKAPDWSNAVVTPGGGVAATISAIRKARGPNKRPTKEQVAIRLDSDVLLAFRSEGRGWQTRVNAALKDWLANRH